MTYFNEARQKARELYYPPPKKRKLKTRNMAKKKSAGDPAKKLLITAIKKTINKNTVLPILEDVLLTRKEAIVSDLETSVVIPFESAVNAAIPANKFIDCLEMMDTPALVQDEPTVKKEEVFELGGIRYLGRRDDMEEKLSAYNASKEEGEEITLEDYVEKYYDKVAPDYEPAEVNHPNFGVTFSEGKRVVKVLGEDPDNFPRIPLLDKDYPVIGSLTETDMGKLATALSFVSSDDLRPAMTGIYFGEDKKGRIVATDAHRLYFDELDEPITRQFILPAKAAKILLALGGEWKITAAEEYKLDKDGEVVLKRTMIKEQREVPYFEVDGIRFRGVEDEERQNYEDSFRRGKMSFKEWLEFKEMMIEDGEMEWVEVPDMTKEPEATLLPITNVCFVGSDGVKMVTRVIDARFPDYKVVIPQDDPNTVVTVNPDELLQELKNASKFANKSTGMVILGANDKLSIAANDVDFAHEYKNEFELAEIQHNHGEGFEIAFNGKFISDIISKENDKPATINLWSPTKCAIINEHYLVMPYLVMPLMIGGDN